jgi:hypothetical protein
MKPRARRVTIGVASLVAFVVAVLVAANWATVRGHVEAWHFQLTTETETVVPNSAWMESPAFERFAEGGDDYTIADLAGWLEVLATKSGRTVVLDTAEKKDLPLQSGFDSALSVLEANGYRVLEQRFPRRAYVIIRDLNFTPKPTLLEQRIKAWRATHPPPAAAPQ